MRLDWILPWVAARRVKEIFAQRNVLAAANATLLISCEEFAAVNKQLVEEKQALLERVAALETDARHSDAARAATIAHLEVVKSDLVRETSARERGALQHEQWSTLTSFQNATLREDLDRAGRFAKRVQRSLDHARQLNAALEADLHALANALRRDLDLWRVSNGADESVLTGADTALEARLERAAQ